MRYVKLFIACFLLFIIQTSLIPYIQIGSVKPNLMLMFTVAAAMIYGARYSVFCGVLFGFLHDCFFAEYIGLNLFVYTSAGFLLGVMCMDIYKSNILNALLIGAAASFVCGLIYYAVDILLKGYTDLPYFILHIILPETVYNCIATIPLFIITLLIYNRAESRRMKYADLE